MADRLFRIACGLALFGWIAWMVSVQARNDRLYAEIDAGPAAQAAAADHVNQEPAPAGDDWYDSESDQDPTAGEYYEEPLSDEWGPAPDAG